MVTPSSSVPRLLVVVTGLSGAGKSTALHALEDLGFFCIDNLPSPVLGEALRACAQGGVAKVAVGVDVRTRRFLDDAVSVLEEIARSGQSEVSILFLDASDEALIRRFSSTRRPHPLSTGGEPGAEAAAAAVVDGVRIERERLASLRARADLIVDTTRLSVHELRRRVVTRFAGQAQHQALRVRILSFGFKYGAPVDADMLFDVRFLDNPFFVEGLRDLPGTSAPVRQFVLDQPDAGTFLGLVVSLMDFALPRYVAEGKSYLTVGIGCTGGRHRSVVVAEHLRSSLATLPGVTFEVVHRDVERVGEEGRASDVGSLPPPRVGGGR